MKSTDTRLVVEIPEILHKQMRVSAAEQNMTIKNWVIIAFLRRLEEEKHETQTK